MISRYGQYCPVSLAAEILGERWTILIILVLCDGVNRYSEIQSALPRISASTLAQRLRSLQEAQIIYKYTSNNNGKIEYHLSEAGEALAPIIMEMGIWGQRWARDLEVEDLDPRHLIWSVHLRLNIDLFPVGRTTIQFEFIDLPLPQRNYWIVINGNKVDVCLKYPGYQSDIKVTSDLRRFVDAWRGFRSFEYEVKQNKIKICGEKSMRKTFPNWLLLSSVAHIKRKRNGRERLLQNRYIT